MITYAAILTANGYTKHHEFRGSECWIKPDAPDCNFDRSTGLFAFEDDRCGMSVKEMQKYLPKIACLNDRCYSPVACGGFGYCRELNMLTRD